MLIENISTIPLPIILGIPLLGLIPLVGTWLARTVTLDVLKMVALKAILMSIVITVLPVVANNFLIDIMQGAFTQLTSIVSPQNLDVSLQFSNLTAWLMEKTRLVECFSVIIGAISTRWAINAIPFLRI